MSYLGATIPATGTPADGLELSLWREGCVVARMCGAAEFDALVAGALALAAWRKNSSCEITRRGVYQTHGHEFDWEGTMNFKGQLTTATAATAFTLAGNATITLVSKRTGTRFTYKVRRPKSERGQPPSTVYFVSVLSGPDNEQDFAYLGMIRTVKVPMKTVGFHHGGHKAKVKPGAPSAMAFAWYWGKLVTQGVLPEELEVWHEGRCGRCGRKLTVPNSIASGFGPDCIDLVGLPTQGGLF